MVLVIKILYEQKTAIQQLEIAELQWKYDPYPFYMQFLYFENTKYTSSV